MIRMEKEEGWYLGVGFNELEFGFTLNHRIKRLYDILGIVNPKLIGADCKSAPAAISFCAYPKEQDSLNA